MASVEPPLRRVLVGYYGFHLGADATAEALAWAWSTWPRCRELANPVAYLFRVGQSRSRRLRRRQILARSDAETAREPEVEPKLRQALLRLSPNQRIAIVLHLGYAWTLAEIGDLLGITRSTVQRHLDRGLVSLRTQLGVEIEHR